MIPNEMPMYSLRPRSPLSVLAFWEWLFAICLVLDGNSVYHAAVYFNLHLPFVCVGLLAMMLFFAAGRSVPSPACRRWSACFAAYFAIYAAIMYDSLAREPYGCMFVLGFPLLILYLDMADRAERGMDFLFKIGDVVFVFGLMGFAFWIVGDCLHLLSHTRSITVHWGSVTPIPTYFGLHCEGQPDVAYGLPLLRNRGIFCEAPMYSLWMSIGVMIELFLRDTPRMTRVVLLSVCILTSICTTGVLFLILAFGLKYSHSFWRAGMGTKIWMGLVCLLVFPILFGFLGDMMSVKSETGSYRTRQEDYVAAYNMFKDYPLMGGGYGNLALITERGYKPYSAQGGNGFSNSITAVLATGGIWNAVVYLGGIFGGVFAMFRRNHRLACFAICFLYLSVTTIFFARFIHAVLLACCVSWLLHRKSHMDSPALPPRNGYNWRLVR